MQGTRSGLGILVAGLIFVASMIGANLCEHARWIHEDGVLGTDSHPYPKGPEAVAHQQALTTLEEVIHVLEAVAILSLGVLLTLIGSRHHHQKAGAAFAFISGALLLVALFFDGLSVMDVSIPEQRPYIPGFQWLYVGALGCFLTSGGLLCCSKAIGVKPAGIFILLATAGFFLLNLRN